MLQYLRTILVHAELLQVDPTSICPYASPSNALQIRCGPVLCQRLQCRDRTIVKGAAQTGTDQTS